MLRLRRVALCPHSVGRREHSVSPGQPTLTMRIGPLSYGRDMCKMKTTAEQLVSNKSDCENVSVIVD